MCPSIPFHSGCMVENIRLSRLETGDYSAVVHYYSDHGQSPTTSKVTLWLRDSVNEFGPRELSDGAVWNIATIQWPSMTVITGD